MGRPELLWLSASSWLLWMMVVLKLAVDGRDVVERHAFMVALRAPAHRQVKLRHQKRNADTTSFPQVQKTQRAKHIEHKRKCETFLASELAVT